VLKVGANINSFNTFRDYSAQRLYKSDCRAVENSKLNTNMDMEGNDKRRCKGGIEYILQ
jgi:hypothetical protein